jgi:tetratricopeptide (TPR) repeat protein
MSNWDEAVKAYRQAIELDPTVSLFYYDLGDILANQWKSEEASLCYRRALELES